MNPLNPPQPASLFTVSDPLSFQRFTNEDHLAVHKHKHEMTLKFGPARTDSVIIAGTCRPRQASAGSGAH